jgi:cation/acetate symporter
MSGVGIAFSRFLGVDFNTGIFAGMGIVFVYAVLGGMKGVTYTQVAQYVVLIFAYTVPAIFISLMLTGNPVPQLGLPVQHQRFEDVSMLQKLDQVPSATSDLPSYTTSSTKSELRHLLLSPPSLMFGTAGLPHVIIRFFTVPSVARRAFCRPAGRWSSSRMLYTVGSRGRGDGQNLT